MEVRPGSQAGRAHIANYLSLTYVNARPNATFEVVKVRVKSLIGLAVLDNHRVAVTALATGKSHPAIARRFNGGAPGRRVIGAFMGAYSIQHRVAPVGVKRRADAGKIHRRTQKSAAHALAIGRVVIRFAFTVDVTNCLKGAAAVVEFRR